MKSKGPKIPKIVFYGAGAVALIILAIRLKKILVNLQTKAEIKAINTEGASGTDLGGAAATIYDSFYNNDWLGITEDETRALDTFMLIPKAEVKDLEKVYFKLYQKNMKADFVEYLEPWQWHVAATQWQE